MPKYVEIFSTTAAELELYLCGDVARRMQTEKLPCSDSILTAKPWEKGSNSLTMSEPITLYQCPQVSLADGFQFPHVVETEDAIITISAVETESFVCNSLGGALLVLNTTSFNHTTMPFPCGFQLKRDGTFSITADGQAFQFSHEDYCIAL